MDRRAFIATVPLLLAACSPAHRLTVGSKNFTEQLILGEMLAQLIAAVTQQPVDRRLYLAGTYICHQALLAGRIDLYAEYTGTALAAVLKQRPSGDHRQVFEEVKERVSTPLWPASLSFSGLRQQLRHGDARRRCAPIEPDQAVAACAFLAQAGMGVGYEFLERRDGYNGLVSTYGLNSPQPRASWI